MKAYNPIIWAIIANQKTASTQFTASTQSCVSFLVFSSAFAFAYYCFQYMGQFRRK